MKRLLAGCCTILHISVSWGQMPDTEGLVNKQEAHAVIQEAAAKIEARFRGTREEADGLAETVNDILARQALETNEGGDRNQQRAAAMHFVLYNFGANANMESVRGFVFDNSPPGHRQRYEELEAGTEGEEVLRWLEMSYFAAKLGWAEKKTMCAERALGAARARVAREPRNAEAHALLAETLNGEDNAEALNAVQTALKLDPRQCRALQILLAKRIAQALATAALRRESGLGEILPASVERLLYERPPSDAEILALGKKEEVLKREAEQLLTLVSERGDLPTYVAVLQNLLTLWWHEQLMLLAAKRSPEASYETFLHQMMMTATEGMSKLFARDAHLNEALRLAGDDPEALGAITLAAVGGDMLAAMRSGKAPSTEKARTAQEVLRRLVELAGADESRKAARASEAACIIQMMGLMQGRRPEHPEMILRTLRLDPFRHRSHGMLLAFCMAQKDKPGVCALARLQLVLVPDMQTRRMAAGAACTMGDWAEAHRLLDGCLKEKPDDIALLNQRAATLLRESQAKAVQRKAAAIYEKIKTLEADEKNAVEKEERELLVRNRVLALAISGRGEQARTELAAALNDQVLDDEAGKELRPLLE